MADFTPVALGAKPPQGMTLADMLNIANAAQQYQQTQQMNPLQLQRARMEIEQAQKMNPLAVQKSRAEVSTAETGAEKSRFELEKSYAEKARGVFGGFTNDPDFISGNSNEIIKKLQASQAFLTSIGVPAHPNGTTAQMIELAKTNPKAVRQQLVNMTQGEMSPESKLGVQFPAAQGLNTGNQVIPVQMGNKMLTGVTPGTPQGLGIETQLPPTTEAVATEGDGTGLPPGTRYIIGPQSQKKPLATALSPTATAANAVVSSDWDATQKAATQAQPRIAIFQNIKKFAPDAFTGVGGARKELAAGILNAVGISAYEAEKVSTEELAKNSALLALAGGNTDAARSLAEIANPNKKLNEKAIKEIANQMIGIEKMNQAKAAFLAPVAQDASKYQEKLNVFNQVADPRLFQEATPEDVARMKARMSKAEIADFGRRVQLLKQMGLTQ